MEKWIGAGLGLVGLLLLVFSVVIYFMQRKFLDGARKAKGKIVDSKRSTGSDGDDMYAPVVEFTDPAGQTVRFTHSVSTSSEPTLGEEVPVVFRPENPQEASIRSFFGIWGSAFILGMMALVFFGVGVSLFFVF